MCLPSNSVTHGGITIPLYKWRLNQCLLHPQRNFVIARIAMDAANRLPAIAAEMEQLQNEMKEHLQVLNYLLRSVRTMDPARKEARIRATRERIEGLEERQQALRAEQEALIVGVATHGHRGD